MDEAMSPIGRCECGRRLAVEEAASGARREVICACGRRHDCELVNGAWVCRDPLTPERSLPLSGFSKELRHASDAERFWFPFPLHGEVPFPVHILFSPSAKKAEIKAADLKAYAMDGVDSASEARRLWIAWWRSTRHQRSRGPSPIVPRRVGRLPRSASLQPPRPVPLRAR